LGAAAEKRQNFNRQTVLIVAPASRSPPFDWHYRQYCGLSAVPVLATASGKSAPSQKCPFPLPVASITPWLSQKLAALSAGGIFFSWGLTLAPAWGILIYNGIVAKILF
jgi:hypothetical protein